MLEKRWVLHARADFRHRERDTPYLGGDHAGQAPILVAALVLDLLVALCAEYGCNLQIDLPL